MVGDALVQIGRKADVVAGVVVGFIEVKEIDRAMIVLHDSTFLLRS